MENKIIPRFIVIDDDPVSNNISKAYLLRLFPEADIKTFTDPQQGLDYILSYFAAPQAENATLFLDINMPFLNGWDVLDGFSGLSEITRQRFKIYMNTSSIAEEDKERAINNPIVSGYIEKPLTMLKLKTHLSDIIG